MLAALVFDLVIDTRATRTTSPREWPTRPVDLDRKGPGSDDGAGRTDGVP